MAKLFVGNLSYSATEADLTAFFNAKSIELETVKVCREKQTGLARGFGFLEVADADAERAIELNGEELLGRKLRIAVAFPPAKGRNL